MFSYLYDTTLFSITYYLTAFPPYYIRNVSGKWKFKRTQDREEKQMIISVTQGPKMETIKQSYTNNFQL